MTNDSSKSKFSNRLLNESSPYLLQHAHNPVDWYPWGEEALEKARSENKVILISIGYSACHWCHVMEKESFESEDVAKIMNENFINIKIDREERPDLDHIYMDAVQAMTGSGGWPLNVFLTPGAKPFYGGTYFPPVKAYNRSSWPEVLNAIKLAWVERQEEIRAQAENLTGHLQKSNGFGLTKKNDDSNLLPVEEQADMIFRNIMKTADTEWGGFGKAPKFPQTFTIRYLLQHYHFTGNKKALEQARLSIDKMLEGGIYDHVGGGLARYSTDEEWLAPHFEKMLYDNALFLNVICEVYQLTKDEYYEKAIRKTIAFVERELMHEEGGFYAALDADSEGEEGKYYVWDKKEVDELLGVEGEVFCDFFNISATGNWEGKNILRILKKPDLFAEEKKLDPGEFELMINESLAKLSSKRNTRIRPSLDDKILLGWNALMITALCKASAALNDDAYRKMAERSFDFIINNFKSSGVELYHTYKNKNAKYPAFLDDYAYLVQACICLQEITSDSNYLVYANQLSDYVTANFSEENTGYFYFTGKNQADVIMRKKEVYDGATPSGNSTMAENLFYLSVIFDKKEWYNIGKKICDGLHTAIVNYPTSFANWATILIKQAYGINEVVITGNGFKEVRNALLERYMPDKILQCDTAGNDEFPLLKGKAQEEGVRIYLCKNYSCLPACNTLEELLFLINDPGNK
jgi:uncharacterized protein